MLSERSRRVTYDATGASRYIEDVHGLTVSPMTLRSYRTKGGGPVAITFGRAMRYRPDALDAWVAEKTSEPQRSTSDR